MAERVSIPHETRLASQVAALEQLLEVYERAVLEQDSVSFVRRCGNFL